MCVGRCEAGGGGGFRRAKEAEPFLSGGIAGFFAELKAL